MRGSFRVGLLAIVGAILTAGPGLAQNLGNIPANRALDARCTETSYLGPMVTGYCTDSHNLMIKSKIDVRTCAGYELAVDAAGRLRCRAPARR